MADTGWLAPTAVTTDTTVGTVAWTNITRIQAADANSSGAIGLSAGAVSNYIVPAFTGTMPSGQQPAGFEIELIYKQTAAGQVRDHTVQLELDGALIGANRAVTATNWPTSLTTRVVGTSADLFGTSGLTAAQANRLKVRIAATNPSSTSSSAALDSVRLRVTYVPVSTGTPGLSGVAPIADDERVPSGQMFGGAQPPAAQVYYVSTSGADVASRDGKTLAAAWKTPAYAASRVDGGTVLLGAGSYTNNLILSQSKSSLVTFKPLLAGLTSAGPWTFRDSSNFQVEGMTFLPVTTSSTNFVHTFYVVGKSSFINAIGNDAGGDAAVNCFWLTATGGHDFILEHNTVHDAAVDKGGPAAFVCAPQGTATYNVWIRFNTCRELYGWDAFQLSTGSSKTTNRHRNIWVEFNDFNGVYQGTSVNAHSDGMQIIGYSGPLVDGTPTEDRTGVRPTGDVGVVIRGNHIQRGRGILVMPTGVPGGGTPTVGEHDSIILDSNLFHDPRGGKDPGPVPDSAAYDFQIKLLNCPNYRVINNTVLAYPLTGFASSGNTGIVVMPRTAGAADSDRGCVNGTLANNISDYINFVESSPTFAYKGYNTYRNSKGYTAGTGDRQGVPGWYDDTNRDFHLAATGSDAGNATYQGLTDMFGIARSTSKPLRGAMALLGGVVTAINLTGGAKAPDNEAVIKGVLAGGDTGKIALRGAAGAADNEVLFPGGATSLAPLPALGIQGRDLIADDETVRPGLLHTTSTDEVKIVGLDVSPWPAGTTVAAYLTSSVAPNGTVTGPPLAVSVVAKNGSIEFPELGHAGSYAAVGSGAVVRFTIIDVNTAEALIKG